MGILTGIVIYRVGRRRGRKRAEKNFKRSASSPVFECDDYEEDDYEENEEEEERHIVPLVLSQPSGPAHRPSHLTRGLR
jgi:hypothetical protein